MRLQDVRPLGLGLAFGLFALVPVHTAEARGDGQSMRTTSMRAPAMRAGTTRTTLVTDRAVRARVATNQVVTTRVVTRRAVATPRTVVRSRVVVGPRVAGFVSRVETGEDQRASGCDPSGRLNGFAPWARGALGCSTLGER